MTGALALLLAGPLLAAAVLVGLRHPVVQRAVAFATIVACAGFGAWLVARTSEGAVLVAQVAGWPAGIAIPFVADRLAALMVTASAVLVGLCGWTAALTGFDRSRIFWPLALVLLAGVNGAYLTGDLFNLFVCVEIMLLPSYVLLTLGRTPEQFAAARVYVPVNLLASTVLLTGIALVYGSAGTVNLAELAARADQPGTQAGLAVVAVALAIKAGLVPVHGWLPRTYPYAAPVVTALFSGLLTKVGIYGLLRLSSLTPPEGVPYGTIVVVVAVASMVVGVLGAVGQGQIRSILVFHMVSQTGYLALGLALTSPAGRTATVVYLLQYVGVKCGLLLVAAALVARYGTDRLDRLGGVAGHQRLLALAFVVLAFSLTGLPPTSGFVAKLALAVAAVGEGQLLAAGVVVAVSLLTLTSMMKIWTGVFWGSATPEVQTEGGPGGVGSSRAAWLAAPPLTLAGVAVALGVAGDLLVGLAAGTVPVLTDPGRYVEAVLGR